MTKSQIALTVDNVVDFHSLSLSLCVFRYDDDCVYCRVYASAVCLVEEGEKRRIDACAYMCVELVQAQTNTTSRMQ